MTGPASPTSWVPKDVYHRVVELRRALHRHPELSWQEQATSDLVVTTLSSLGLSPRTGIAGTGVLADLPGISKGPLVALRADMDALPIQEATGLPFQSEHAGVMHACGHDLHMATLLGAAMLLTREKALPTPVRFIFQPAEETGAGARELIEHGALEHVGMIFGAHVDLRHDPGQIVVHEGTVNASTDEFTITLSGPGGHAARPHESVDPIVAAGFLLTELQSLVSRRLPPSEPAVVTVGRIEGGTAPNILASRLRLDGTLRAHTQETRQRLIHDVQDTAAAVGSAHGVAVETTIQGGTPPVVNGGQGITVCREAARRTVGPDGIRVLDVPNMGGEDFGYYLERVPGAFVRFGARPADRDVGPAHSSRFDADELVLAMGARFFAEAAMLAGLELSTARKASGR
ncbi:MAG: M20 family metallopeptidase [Gemmatimonadota bacterium]|nr:M20 family metallopeptidase [Gemmatimonadota bacterium]